MDDTLRDLEQTVTEISAQVTVLIGELRRVKEERDLLRIALAAALKTPLARTVGH